MSIDVASGLVQWTSRAAQDGDNPVIVRVEDSSGLSDTQSYTIAVTLTTATVPDLVGLTQAEAEAAIIAADLIVGTITGVNSGTVPAGEVISQSLTAGDSATGGSVVDMVVSRGPAPVTVPNVVGLS